MLGLYGWHRDASYPRNVISGYLVWPHWSIADQRQSIPKKLNKCFRGEFGISQDFPQQAPPDVTSPVDRYRNQLFVVISHADVASPSAVRSEIRPFREPVQPLPSSMRGFAPSRSDFDALNPHEFTGELRVLFLETEPYDLPDVLHQFVNCTSLAVTRSSTAGLLPRKTRPRPFR